MTVGKIKRKYPYSYLTLNNWGNSGKSVMQVALYHLRRVQFFYINNIQLLVILNLIEEIL